MSSSEYGLPGDVANRWRFLREFLQLATAVLHVQRRRRCCCCCSVVVVEGRKEVASAKTSRTKNPFFGVRGGDDWRPSPRPCHVVRLLLRSRPHPSSRTFPGAAGPGACGAERSALADSTCEGKKPKRRSESSQARVGRVRGRRGHSPTPRQPLALARGSLMRRKILERIHE